VITLEQLLESREARAAKQRELLGSFPSAALICLTVQLPGSEKRNPTSLAIARAALEAIREEFPERLVDEEKDLETGYEGYFVVPSASLGKAGGIREEAKRRACRIEDTHPLGRLMDIDVIGPDGPLSRASIGLPERRCLLCDKPARVCMRARSHTTEELLDKIQQLVSKYI